MENRKDTQMIYLKDLIFAALHRWRAVLIIALVLAMALGGGKCISGLQSLQSSAPALVDPQYTLSLERYNTEKASIDGQISALNGSIESQGHYLVNSILMQLDPYHFYEASLTLYVQTDYQIQPGMSYQNPDPTNDVIRGYEAILGGNQAVQAMAEEMETEPQYLLELITVEIPEETNTLLVKMKYTSQEGAEKLLELLAQQVDNAHGQVTQAIAEHSVKIVEQTVSQQVDLELSTQQKTETDRMNALLASLDSAELQLSQLVPPSQAQAVTKAAVLKDSVVLAVVGGVLGVFLSVVVIWVAHIAGSKVYSARALESRTGIKVLGCLSDGTKKNAIDRWLCKAEGRNTADPSERSAMLAVDIRNRCPQAKRVVVTGDMPAEIREPLAQALRKAMPNIAVESCDSLLVSAAALEALNSCDAVVLMAQCGKSQYTTVTREAEIIADYGKVMPGCVLLGG